MKRVPLWFGILVVVLGLSTATWLLWIGARSVGDFLGITLVTIVPGGFAAASIFVLIRYRDGKSESNREVRGFAVVVRKPRIADATKDAEGN